MISFNTRARKIAPLLFGSGLCALIYQIVWTREFRLIFGASTAASAAVLAMFIGGLGIGGLLLGTRADQRARPLAFYAQLETLIAISTAATPGLLWFVRWLYIQLGGSVVLGMAGGTAVRLFLAALVLAIPTFLMGGTLPAAARAVETDDDKGRRNVALLYGVNTLGAVTGSVLATFFLLEIFGTRTSLWIATLLNLLVAIIARKLSRASEPREVSAPAARPTDHAVASARSLTQGPILFVLSAAGLVGFAFFLMELVWYRMLGPLLGGTVFTFGLILAVALLGIGLGGTFYSLYGKNKPATLNGFASTCLLESVAIIVPFALGDRLALLALLLRPLGNVGFLGHVCAWSVVTGIVVLPAAFIAGVQFPLLIALLGQARANVGREIGLVYASNTVGAIVGALAGGFGLLPALTAPGCWRLVALMLAALGIAAALLAGLKGKERIRLVPHFASAIAVLLMSFALGPTAAWRHSPIGAGRISAQHVSTPNDIRDWMHSQRASIRWEAEGIESSVALDAVNALAFVVNGKVDGNARRDAATAVMSGLLGAMIHGNPTNAMVIGLGTGSTAGWLAAIPAMERVDVVELEPAMLHVARACAPVNLRALDNPKLHLRIGDAREVLLTTPSKYDVIFSEPSNPYRAGVAGLFTREYYEAVAVRLREGGVFLQWVQAYEVDARTVRMIYATLASVFPEVESWQLGPADLLLVASKKPFSHDLRAWRDLIQLEPYKSALAAAWRVTDLEGVLAHYIAGPALAQAIATKQGNYINTDDQNHVEFSFARNVGSAEHVDAYQMLRAAQVLKTHRPALQDDSGVDWARVEEKRIDVYVALGREPPAIPFSFSSDAKNRIRAQLEFLKGNRKTALDAWRAQPREPETLNELVVVASALADIGDDRARSHLSRLPMTHQTEALSVLARLQFRQGKITEAAQSLESSLIRFQQDPWAWEPAMSDALSLLEPIASVEKERARELFTILQKPFAVNCLELERMDKALKLARRVDFKESCVQALKPFEPMVPWNAEFLRLRYHCYQLTGHPNLGKANHDLDEFLENASEPFGEDLLPAATSGESQNTARVADPPGREEESLSARSHSQ